MSRLFRNIVRPNIENSALFICDVQERFRPLIHNMTTVIHRCEALNNACNVLNIPILISEQYPKALGSTVPEITRHSNTFIYPKTKFSMVVDEVDSQFLKNDPTKIKQVFICGIETHVCVLQSTIDLMSQGVDVFIVCDAVSSQRPYDRKIALETLKDAGAHLTTAESLIFGLMRDSSHPQFKEISKIVKESNDACPHEFTYY